jgi:tight adherence protein B
MNAPIASFWGSEVGLFVALGILFMAVFLVTTMLLGGREKRRRELALAKRLGRGHPAEEAETEEKPVAVATKWVPSGFAEFGRRFAVASGFSAALDDRLERAGLPIASGEFVALTAICGVAGALFAALLVQHIVFVLLIAAMAAMVPYYWMIRSEKKRLNAITDQLADTLTVLASSLRAGYSFLQALDTVSKEISEPSAHEFQRVVAEIRLGRPIDDALLAMAERTGSNDLKWAVIAINVQREVGGNLAEILDIVANTVRERAYIRRQVRVLTAEGRMSVAILCALPFLLFLYMLVVNPEYVSLLWTRTAGVVMLAGGAVLMGTGILIMSRIVKIDV